jgi:AraC family transcriptional activator FtrA
MPSCASWRAARVEHDQPGAPASRSACTSLTSVSQSTSCSLPARCGLRPRLPASLELLETTDLPVEEVARHVGFETAVTYRSHFARTFRTSPSGYRRAFRAGAPRPAA